MVVLTRAGTKEPSEWPVTGLAGPNTVGAESWLESVERNALSSETKPCGATSTTKTMTTEA